MIPNYIGIINNDWITLKELHEVQKNNNFDERKALAFCLYMQTQIMMNL
jgi:hypothetical protein